MLVYFVFLAAVVLIGIPLCRNRTGKAVYCSIAGTALFVFAAIRKYTGFDYNLYAQTFIDFLSMDAEEIGYFRFEKGISMPMKLLGDVMFTDYQWMFVGYAFIVALSLMIILFKTSDKPYLGVFFFLTLGLYFNSLNFMRQMIASFIVVLGMRYIKTGQFFRYLLVVLFASCFHLSALVMIPFYFILKIKLTPVTLGIYSGLGLLVFIFSWPVIQFITQHFLPKYYNYGLEDEGQHELMGNRWVIYTIYFGVCFVLSFLFRKRLTEKDPLNRVWLNCMFFAFYIELLSLKHNMVGRLELPFLLAAAAILLPRVVECLIEWCGEKFGSSRRRALTACTASVAALTVMCTGMYGYMIGHNYNGVNPYQTIYDDTPWVDPVEVWEKPEQ